MRLTSAAAKLNGEASMWFATNFIELSRFSLDERPTRLHKVKTAPEKLACHSQESLRHHCFSMRYSGHDPAHLCSRLFTCMHDGYAASNK